MSAQNSLDLNAIEYKICDVAQQQVYQSRAHKIDELKQFLLHFRRGKDQTSFRCRRH